MLALAASALSCAFQGTTVGPGEQVFPAAAACDDEVGLDVAIDGDTLLVGAPRHDLNGSSSADFGCVFVYRQDAQGWHPEAILDAAPGGIGVPRSYLGHSVALEGDRALVGAPGFPSLGYQDSGAVVGFTRDATIGWRRDGLLAPVTVGPDDRFGSSVAFDADRAIVGAPRDDTVATDAGAAYALTHGAGGWDFEVMLFAPDGGAGDGFGPCALDGDWAAVGAPRADAVGANSGAVYLFRHDGSAWSFAQKLTASDASAGDQFGASVCIEGGRLAVGAHGAGPGTGSSAGDVGAAYVFEIDAQASWVEVEMLPPPDAGNNLEFGYDVELEGDLLIVGDPGATVDIAGHGNRRTGAAYLYQWLGSAWALQGRVERPDISISHANERFGGSVTLTAVGCAIGAPESCRAFAVHNFTQVFERYCDPAVPTSAGTPASLDGIGNSIVSRNELGLECTGMPAQSVGFFIAGDALAFVPGPGGSNGDLCIGGTILRFDDLVLSTGSTGSFGRSIDVTNAPVVGTFQVGDLWRFQAWFRDGASSNFSNALVVPFR